MGFDCGLTFSLCFHFDLGLGTWTCLCFGIWFPEVSGFSGFLLPETSGFGCDFSFLVSGLISFTLHGLHVSFCVLWGLRSA